MAVGIDEKGGPVLPRSFMLLTLMFAIIGLYLITVHDSKLVVAITDGYSASHCNGI